MIKINKKQIKERVGLKFSKLTIIGFHGIRSDLKNNTNYYKVKCDCGNEKLIQFSSLKSGKTTSCGCYHKVCNKTELKFTKKDNYFIVRCSNGKFLIDIEDYDKIKNIDSTVFIDNNGYAIYYINKKTYYIHRLVKNMGEFDGTSVIDHINRDKLDDRKFNLRIVTHIENSQNIGIRSHNNSGVTGVGWHKRDKKWRARIALNKKEIRLGLFDNFEDAVRARRNAEKKYFTI